MSRSSHLEHAQRINTALNLLRECDTLSEAAAVLARHYAISKRQAYRYLRKAQASGQPVPVPDPKIVFTVKLSSRLIRELRAYAAPRRQSLSELVTHALEAYLNQRRGRG